MVSEYLDRIASELGRVEVLLRSLKSFSLYEQPEVRRTDVAQVADEFAGLVGDEARQLEVGLEVEAAGPCWAACDSRALHQVLLNLFANAVDALAGRPDPTIRIATWRAERLVCLSFADSGAGMSGEQQRGLFRPFYTSKVHGTGLGLVISRKLLSQMGGTIAVDSTEGVGTTVTVTLPAAD